MCSEYSANVSLNAIEGAFEQLSIPLVFPKSALAPCSRGEIRVAQAAPVIRGVGRGKVAELVEMCWGWRATNGRTVFNFRAESRGFAHGRCLIPALDYYDACAEGRGRSRISLADEPWFCIAGFWRPAGAGGDAFTMLTLPQRQWDNRTGDRIVVLARRDWARWLDLDVPASECLTPLPLDRLRLDAA